MTLRELILQHNGQGYRKTAEHKVFFNQTETDIHTLLALGEITAQDILADDWQPLDQQGHISRSEYWRICADHLKTIEDDGEYIAVKKFAEFLDKKLFTPPSTDTK